MGYYSDVCIVFNKKGIDKFDELVNKLSTELQEAVRNTLERGSRHEKDGDTLFYIEFTKWYYDGPETINDILRELDEDDYYMLINGEESDDIEIRGMYMDNKFNAHIETFIDFEE